MESAGLDTDEELIISSDFDVAAGFRNGKMLLEMEEETESDAARLDDDEVDAAVEQLARDKARRRQQHAIAGAVVQGDVGANEHFRFEASGREVLREQRLAQGGPVMVDLQGLADGTYRIQLAQETSLWQGAVVLQR